MTLPRGRVVQGCLSLVSAGLGFWFARDMVVLEPAPPTMLWYFLVATFLLPHFMIYRIVAEPIYPEILPPYEYRITQVAWRRKLFRGVAYVLPIASAHCVGIVAGSFALPWFLIVFHLFALAQTTTMWLFAEWVIDFYQIR